ncbi:MAG: transposase [candidate division NC10 bacterium]|nr:transposase [candidate division NC10 bacterium]
MSYWKLYYHIAWATYDRLPLIDAGSEGVIARTLHSKAKELGCYIHTLGMVEEHLHVAATIPPTLALAKVVGEMKGCSSHAVNHVRPPTQRVFKWQDGYGVVSFGERSLPAITVYVRNQKRHHAGGTTNPLFERIDAGLQCRSPR